MRNKLYEDDLSSSPSALPLQLLDGRGSGNLQLMTRSAYEDAGTISTECTTQETQGVMGRGTE